MLNVSDDLFFVSKSIANSLWVNVTFCLSQSFDILLIVSSVLSFTVSNMKNRVNWLMCDFASKWLRAMYMKTSAMYDIVDEITKFYCLNAHKQRHIEPNTFFLVAVECATVSFVWEQHWVTPVDSESFVSLSSDKRHCYSDMFIALAISLWFQTYFFRLCFFFRFGITKSIDFFVSFNSAIVGQFSALYFCSRLLRFRH